MSKSLGNFFALGDIFAKYDPTVVRYFLLSQHYRSPLDFSDDGLKQSVSACRRIQNALDFRADGGTPSGEDKKRELLDGFDAAMADDFNTAAALSSVHAAVDMVFAGAVGTVAALAEMLDVLGIAMSAGGNQFPPEALKLASEREAARKAKNYALSDDIRAKLNALGYAVEDTKSGAKIKKI
jgi:cysteinyl-tRNA synthetase